MTIKNSNRKILFFKIGELYKHPKHLFKLNKLSYLSKSHRKCQFFQLSQKLKQHIISLSSS